MRGDEIDLIDAKLRGKKDPKVRDRLRMILCWKKDINRENSVQKKRYEREGFEGLKTRKQTGRKRRLEDDDLEDIKRLLKQRDYWTTEEVRDLIKREFDVEYTLRHVQRILRKMGMSYQKPYAN